MALYEHHVDLGMSDLLVPGFVAYQPPFGTKVSPGQSLSPLQANSNMMLPYTKFNTVSVNGDVVFKDSVLTDDTNVVYLDSVAHDCTVHLHSYTKTAPVEFRVVDPTPTTDVVTVTLVVSSADATVKNSDGTVDLGTVGNKGETLMSRLSVTKDGNVSLVWSSSGGDGGLSPATPTTVGVVKPDGTTITVNSEGLISVPTASDTSLGVVRPDGTSIVIGNGGVLSSKSGAIATDSAVGLVKPGAGLAVDGAGSLSVSLPDFDQSLPDGTLCHQKGPCKFGLDHTVDSTKNSLILSAGYSKNLGGDVLVGSYTFYVPGCEHSIFSIFTGVKNFYSAYCCGDVGDEFVFFAVATYGADVVLLRIGIRPSLSFTNGYFVEVTVKDTVLGADVLGTLPYETSFAAHDGKLYFFLTGGTGKSSVYELSEDSSAATAVPDADLSGIRTALTSPHITFSTSGKVCVSAASSVTPGVYFADSVTGPYTLDSAVTAAAYVGDTLVWYNSALHDLRYGYPGGSSLFTFPTLGYSDYIYPAVAVSEAAVVVCYEPHSDGGGSIMSPVIWFLCDIATGTSRVLFSHDPEFLGVSLMIASPVKSAPSKLYLASPVYAQLDPVSVVSGGVPVALS